MEEWSGRWRKGSVGGGAVGGGGERYFMEGSGRLKKGAIGRREG